MLHQLYKRIVRCFPMAFARQQEKKRTTNFKLSFL